MKYESFDKFIYNLIYLNMSSLVICGFTLSLICLIIIVSCGMSKVKTWENKHYYGKCVSNANQIVNNTACNPDTCNVYYELYCSFTGVDTPIQNITNIFKIDGSYNINKIHETENKTCCNTCFHHCYVRISKKKIVFHKFRLMNWSHYSFVIVFSTWTGCFLLAIFWNIITKIKHRTYQRNLRSNLHIEELDNVNPNSNHNNDNGDSDGDVQLFAIDSTDNRNNNHVNLFDPNNPVNTMNLSINPLPEVPKSSITVDPKVQKFRNEIEKYNNELKDVSNEYICPISHEIMMDPVLCNDTYTYERESIEKHLKKSKISPINPSIIICHVIENRGLRNTIYNYLKQKGCDI